MSRIKITYEDAIKKGGKRGTVKSFSYPAWSLSKEQGTVNYKRAKAYLPYGYDTAREYPVLYLMHDEGGDEATLLPTEPNEDGSMIAYIADYLIRKGAAKEMIIVCPNGRTCADFQNKSVGNFPDEIMGSLLGFYEFDRELRRDLLPYIDAHFSVRKDREGRAIAGISLGGMQAVNLGVMRCGDLFAYAGAFSPSATTAAGALIGRAIKEQRKRLSLFFASCGLADENLPVYRGLFAGLEEMAAGGIERVEKREYEELGHGFEAYNKSFYEFLQIIFQSS